MPYELDGIRTALKFTKGEKEDSQKFPDRLCGAPLLETKRYSREADNYTPAHIKNTVNLCLYIAVCVHGMMNN